MSSDDGPKDLKRLFCYGLTWATNEEALKAAFSKHGTVTNCRISMKPEDPTKSRGFGFITFATEEDCKAGKEAMDGQDLNGRTIRLEYATERPDRRPGGGYSGGGGVAFGQPGPMGYQQGPPPGGYGGGMAAQAPPQPYAAPPPAEANLPEGWQQAHDEQGRQYFYHHPSKTSQWEMPTRQALQPPSGGPMGAPADGGYQRYDNRPRPY